MHSESEIPPPATDTSNEKQLCLSCMFPNECGVHFCAECGAPLTSYAATGPFESIFAEGHVYRQAAERPRSFIVVLGIWMIFGALALTGATLLAFGRDLGLVGVVIGALLLVISLAMIVKTTRNYFAAKNGRRSAMPSNHRPCIFSISDQLAFEYFQA